MTIEITKSIPESLGKKHQIATFCQNKKIFGKFKNSSQTESRLKELSEQFQKKELGSSLEYLPFESGLMALSPLPLKPGLDNSDSIRVGAFNLIQALKEKNPETIILVLNNASKSEVQSILEAVYWSQYQYQVYKSSPKKITLKSIQVVADPKDITLIKKSNDRLNHTFKGIGACRDWVNTPGSDLTPEMFAKEAQKIAKEAGLDIRIRREKELEKEGFNGLLTVSRGSLNPPRMVTLSYTGASKKAPHLVLVGKGVTFDTGGLSLKPGSGMWEMKCDMAGAATVLASIYICSLLKLKVNVSSVMVLAENRPGQQAVLPGDIFKAKNGKTVMVENTDAEGRLILSDGLAEAAAIKGTHVVNLATLTGAMIRALGPAWAGILGNDSKLLKQVHQLGQVEGEKFWEMPLEEEYRSSLDDITADFKNLGRAEGGAITAALFLKEFVEPHLKWCHIDIAGPAFTTSQWKYFIPGGTGWGVKTMVSLAENLK